MHVPDCSVCLGTQSAPMKQKEGQPFKWKIHTGLGVHTCGSYELFDIFVLPKEPPEISFLIQGKKSTFSKAVQTQPPQTQTKEKHF